jgi:hypothetical protein
MSTDKTIIIHLEAMPCEVPVAIRVRQLLKTALRRHRLRCVRIDGDSLGESEKAQPHLSAPMRPLKDPVRGADRETRAIG